MWALLVVVQRYVLYGKKRIKLIFRINGRKVHGMNTIVIQFISLIFCHGDKYLGVVCVCVLLQLISSGLKSCELVLFRIPVFYYILICFHFWWYPFPHFIWPFLSDSYCMYVPHDYSLNIHCCENLDSHISHFV
jgi:hypothetical protein